MTGILDYIVIVIASYLIGAIPFGYLMVKIAKRGEDIRNYGSHNIGATNVLRVLGKVESLERLRDQAVQAVGA